ncbi:GTP-binding protein [Roseibacillus persicicus]|uniref:GTP-binding protein n=1 Tax=Roseibacillus persicicus TaxID=454148 RepID=UPI00280C50AC|nr:GTP-binding protein [Roseibacillus persicicus]MDQ8191319.1 GTP-binding protein [Roseibacillus persicicus]
MNVRFSSIEKNAGRFFLIGGFLGAGKTSLIRIIFLRLRDLQLETALVTNDQGEGLLDTDSARETLSFSSTHSASDNDYLCDNIDTKEISGDEKTPQESPPPPLVSEITGGCFCCRLEELVGTIETLSQESRPDVIVAEPVGSCTDLMATVIRPLEQIYKTPLTLAPLSVVLDARRALAALGGKRNKRDFHRDVGYIYRKQLEEAEWLVVNKCDLMAAEDLADLERRLARSFPGKRTFYLSAKTGEGLDEWLEALLNDWTPRPCRLLHLLRRIFPRWLSVAPGRSSHWVGTKLLFIMRNFSRWIRGKASISSSRHSEKERQKKARARVLSPKYVTSRNRFFFAE